MPVSTADDFFALLEQSELLSSSQFDSIRTIVPVHLMHDPTKVAAELTRKRWLTSWQAQQLLAGRSRFIFGKYKLLEQIGIGGMGVVYKAEMTAMERIVALKMMAKELLSNQEAIARFQREVRAAAKLNHPNVCCAYDAICEGQTYFLVLEYVDGGNLNQWIKRFNPLPVDWCCEVIRQAALGLQHANEHGVVHRDIKPGNILVIGDNPYSMPQVKLLDMGLARLVTFPDDNQPRYLTRHGQVLGTPDYIAPEQARDTRDADIRCDIFSLGCTFFKLLAAGLPYGGNTPMEKIMARTQAAAPKITSKRSDVPPGVEAVLAKMLERDPEQRYQQPWELVQALAQFSIVNRLSRSIATHSPGSSSIMTQAFSEMLQAQARNKLAEEESLQGSSQQIALEASSNGNSANEKTSHASEATVSSLKSDTIVTGDPHRGLKMLVVVLTLISAAAIGTLVSLLLYISKGS